MSRTPENTENRQAPAEETADLFAFTLAVILAVRMYRELKRREEGVLSKSKENC